MVPPPNPDPTRSWLNAGVLTKEGGEERRRGHVARRLSPTHIFVHTPPTYFMGMYKEIHAVRRRRGRGGGGGGGGEGGGRGGGGGGGGGRGARRRDEDAGGRGGRFANHRRPAAQFLVPAIPPLKNVVIEEFVDEVDMGEDHSPAAIPLELQHVHRISVNRRWG